MKKNQKKLMYLSGALVGLGVLRFYLKKQQKKINLENKEENFIEDETLNQSKTGYEERKYIKIK